MQSDVALDKIRKLLAMAEAEGITDEARESYNQKATELIARYGIDQARLDASKKRPTSAGDVLITIDAPYALDKLGIMCAVAFPLGCRIVSRKSTTPGRPGQEAHLFGMAADLDRTQILFTSLLVQATFGLAATPLPTGEDPRAFRRSWLAGFANAVSRRLTAAERAAKARAAQEDSTTTGPSTALVLADRAALVERRVADAYPRLRSARTRQLSGSGRREGYRAGERADLGGTRLTTTRRPVLGS